LIFPMRRKTLVLRMRTTGRSVYRRVPSLTPLKDSHSTQKKHQAQSKGNVVRTGPWWWGLEVGLPAHRNNQETSFSDVASKDVLLFGLVPLKETSGTIER